MGKPSTRLPSTCSSASGGRLVRREFLKQNADGFHDYLIDGRATAVNRAHSAEVTAIQSDLATRARCAPPPTSVPPIPMRGECQEGRCVAVPDMMADS